jgi:hypothetical protein
MFAFTKYYDSLADIIAEADSLFDRLFGILSWLAIGLLIIWGLTGAMAQL